jgi:hypothetical protein
VIINPWNKHEILRIETIKTKQHYGHEATQKWIKIKDPFQNLSSFLLQKANILKYIKMSLSVSFSLMGVKLRSSRHRVSIG